MSGENRRRRGFAIRSTCGNVLFSARPRRTSAPCKPPPILPHNKNTQKYHKRQMNTSLSKRAAVKMPSKRPAHRQPAAVQGAHGKTRHRRAPPKPPPECAKILKTRTAPDWLPELQRLTPHPSKRIFGSFSRKFPIPPEQIRRRKALRKISPATPPSKVAQATRNR